MFIYQCLVSPSVLANVFMAFLLTLAVCPTPVV